MPTTRHLEIPGADPGRVLTFEHRDGDDVATISTTRGRQVSLGVDDLRELESAVADAIGAILTVSTTTDDDEATRQAGARDQRGELAEAGA